MSDLEPVGNKEITSAGVRGIGATIGGLGLLVLRGVAGFLGGIGGIVLGGLSFILGASSLKSHSATDKRGGTIAMVAGVVLALPGLAHFLGRIPLIGGVLKAAAGFEGFIMGAGIIGLLGYGVFNIVKFVRGLHSRR
jgi:hypothetical protein